MILAAGVNRLLFRHICLAEEVARPPPPGTAAGQGASTESATKNTKTKHTKGRGKGSRYSHSSSPGASSNYRGYTDSEEEDEEEDMERAIAMGEDIESGGGGRNENGGGGWMMKPKMLFGGFAKKVAEGATHAHAAAGSPLKSNPKKSAVALARSRHRRDRIVAWLCEYLNLNPFDRALSEKVTEVGL
jgi:hypothetical protein